MNFVLGNLTPSGYGALKPYLIEAALDEIANHASAGGAHVNFVVSGVLAITAAPRSPAVGIALVGPEGLSGLSSALGSEPAPFGQEVVVNGKALRVEASRLRSIMRENADLREVIGRYARARSIQVAQTIHAASRHSLHERVAGWILGVRERIAENEFSATHEMIAQLLGVRRPGVIAMHVLEGEHLIRNRRKRLIVLDRLGLEAKAAGAFSPSGCSYAELFLSNKTNILDLAA